VTWAVGISAKHLFGPQAQKYPEQLKVLTLKLYSFGMETAPDGSAAPLIHDGHDPGGLIFHKGAVADDCDKPLDLVVGGISSFLPGSRLGLEALEVRHSPIEALSA
jgi:hypothetical protein